MTHSDERRQFGRVELNPPLEASLDGMPVRVIDASVMGFRIAHDARIVPVPTRRIRVQWDGKTMEFGVVVARSVLHRLAQKPGEQTVYHSGIHILEATGDSDRMLRDMIEARVIGALDEMKANARGIPPISSYTAHAEKSDRFRRCELVDGVWRKSETSNREQPENGFTISADVESPHVDILCKLFESVNQEGKRLTKMLAELSITRGEGTSAGRYIP
ncbi:MAG TPA: hypothetical protein VLU46_03955 [Thermoanaerobaculia bacterium]|nr:hypothetical protein [Thermoanaerobaculia bacterium]